jgi:uncharacterized membrane protein
MNDQTTKGAKRSYSTLRWALIGVYAFVTLTTPFLVASTTPLVLAIEDLIYVLLIFAIAGLHGIERYRLKNTAVFFLITWAVSLLFEITSIHTGWPFGAYHYATPAAISIYGVPLIIIFAYFGTGYFSWMLAHVFTGQLSMKLKGKWLVVVPFIAAFIMVMWDVGMDPVSSTVLSLWVWETPGPYFGVPITNFVGWFVTVFIFYQLFALFLSKYDRLNPQKRATLSSKPYWIEASVMYGLIGLGNVLIPISVNNGITQSMA